MEGGSSLREMNNSQKIISATQVATAFFDGAYIQQIRMAAYGVAIFIDGRKVFEDGQPCTNRALSSNVAEYEGFIAIAKWALAYTAPLTKLYIHGDSKLVIEQLSGRWKVKGGVYMPSYVKANELLLAMRRKYNVTLAWVPREKNALADHLSKQGIAHGRRHAQMKHQAENDPLNTFHQYVADY